MSPTTSSFARRLRNARRTHGLSQAELGSRAGISGSQVYRLEAADREPRLSTVIALARALGKDPAELVRDLR